MRGFPDVEGVAVRDALKGAILMIENDVLRLLHLIPITWKDDCYFFDRGIRFIVPPSVAILIKVKRDCTLLFKRQVGS